MTAREFAQESNDWKSSRFVWDGGAHAFAEAYSQAENERLRGCLNSITAALGVKQSKQGLTAFERELRRVVRAALRPEQRKDGENG